MSKCEKNNIAVMQLVADLISIWHDTLGICGNYWEGANMGNLLFTTITYKRVDDILCSELKRLVEEGWIEENEIKKGVSKDLFKDFFDELTYLMLPKQRWLYVQCSNEITKSFNAAITDINILNYNNLAYGDTLIPTTVLFDHCLSDILLKWMNRLSMFDFSELSETEWVKISRHIRKNYIK